MALIWSDAAFLRESQIEGMNMVIIGHIFKP